MSDGASIKFGRKDALFARLRRARPSLTRELVKAVNKAAQEHAALATAMAPEDQGDLRRSIQATPATNSINPSARVEAGDETAFYAHWVEFGTSPHEQGGAFAGSQHPGNEPQPFMFPAYRLLNKRNTARIGRAIAKGIKKGVS